MQQGFNPARRNRNIGTAKQGHGQNNRMIVPHPRNAPFDATLHPRRRVRVSVGGKEIDVVVEETNGGCVHACTVADLCHLLSYVPAADWSGLETFVLRQSSRKKRTLTPAWGRLFYHADLALPEGATIIGPAIFIEAVPPGSQVVWSTSLDPEDSAELERLRLDGHRIERVGRRFVISTSPESVRATQLYRTLLHEIGHWFDWLEKVETPSARGGDFPALSDRYFARDKSEREAFAHRYATELRQSLEERGVIPFARINDE